MSEPQGRGESAGWPVARFDFHLISNRGRPVPPGADEFTSFLKSYIAVWAGQVFFRGGSLPMRRRASGKSAGGS